jgi:DNA-binding transcriptional ArsR family regulator
MASTAAVLDKSFQALANATRRALVERLLAGPATVSELAKPFRMALPSLLQHLQVLEASGLVRSFKSGRVRTVQVVPKRLEHVADWLEKQRSLWNARLDQFDSYVTSMEKER